MIRRFGWAAGLTSILAGAFFAAAALAGEGDAPPKPGSQPEAKRSRVGSDQVLGRLGLSDEQIAKIEALYSECQKKLAEFQKTNVEQEPAKQGGLPGMSKEAWGRLMEKQKELSAERDAKVAGELTGEQKEKFEAALVICKEFRGKLDQANKEYAERRRQILEEQEKQLGERIGKLKLPPGKHGT